MAAPPFKPFLPIARWTVSPDKEGLAEQCAPPRWVLLIGHEATIHLADASQRSPCRALMVRACRGVVAHTPGHLRHGAAIVPIGQGEPPDLAPTEEDWGVDTPCWRQKGVG